MRRLEITRLNVYVAAILLVLAQVLPSSETGVTMEDSSDLPINLTYYDTRAIDAQVEFEMSYEKRLMRDLTLKYRRLGNDGRPVKNISQPVTVEFGLGLIKMELNEKENMLSISCWTRFIWRDEYLTWDPAAYGGVTNVKIHNDKIWLPDIMLYNTANTDESERKVKATVDFDGTVRFFPHRVFQSSCSIDVRNFPFDNQTCYLWFGSWTHSIDEVDAQLAFPEGIDLGTFKSVYKEACEWDIFNTTAERIVMPPEGPGPKYAILSFTVHLKRKLMFSTYILTMPACFLAFLTLLEFWLPPEHADKSALGLTIFGSLLLLLLILVEAAPPTASAIPLLGIYYCFTTVIVILSIFLSSMIVKIGRAGDTGDRPPRLIRLLVLQGLGRLFCMRTPYVSCQRHRRSSRESVCPTELSEKEPLSGGGVGGGGGIPKDERERLEIFDEFKVNGCVSSLTSIERTIRLLFDLLRSVINRKMEEEKVAHAQRDIDLEWRQVALVLDRLFFFCYLIVIIGSLVFLFPRRVET